MKPVRLVALCALAIVIASAMVCVASPGTPAQAQSYDPTILARQAELAATAQERGRQSAAATRQRQDELNALHDAEKKTAMELVSSRATEQYWAGQTATPIAQTATAASATSAAQSTSIARTATATARMATAAAVETSDAIAYQATADANAAQRRQTAISQSLQAVRVLGYLALVGIGIALGVLVWRKAISPARPVVVVQPESEQHQNEPVDVIDEGIVEVGEGADITDDPRVSAYVIELLRKQDRGADPATGGSRDVHDNSSSE